MQMFIEKGTSGEVRFGGRVEYAFKSGKVRIGWSEYYSFAKILDYYEECGGQFEEVVEVAMSQPVKKDLIVKEDVPVLFRELMNYFSEFGNTRNVHGCNSNVHFTVDGIPYIIKFEKFK